MSLFESSPTYGGLLLKLAVDVGLHKQRSDIAGGVGLPDDGLKLTTLKNALDASFQLVRSKRTWSWLHTRIEVTLDPDGESEDCVNASATAYWLPLSVARAPVGRVYGVDPASTTSGVFPVSVYGETALLERIAATGTDTGRPSGVAFGIEALDADGDRARPRMFLRVYPKPDKAYIVSFLAKSRLETLAEFTERPDWPAEMDSCIIWGAIAHMASLGQCQSAISADKAEDRFKELLQSAMVEDAQIDVGVIGTLQAKMPRGGQLAQTLDSDGLTVL